MAPATSLPELATAGLSPLQQRIVEFARTGRGNGVIRATAGAGKTSTLVAVARSLPSDLRSCFLAFARDAANELSNRLPATVPAMTVHALARKTLKLGLAARGVGLQPVDRGKYGRLLRTAFERVDGHLFAGDEVRRYAAEYLAALVHLVRLNLVDCRDADAVAALCEQHGLSRGWSGEVDAVLLALLADVLSAGIDEALKDGITDFTDMLYVPIVAGFPPPRFDFVCVDEAQDYSSLALEFTLKLVDPELNGRLLFVGDPSQGIFGFAGADAGAMDRIVTRSKAKVLPLSVTYRCPTSHVHLAKLLTPEIQARPGAPVGRIYWVGARVLERWTRAGDLLICRANAPLVEICLRLVRAGRKAFVLGREIAAKLRETALTTFPHGTPWRERRLAALLRAAEAHWQHELALGTNHSRAASAEQLDLLACLRYLLAFGKRDRPQSLPQLLGAVDELFESQENAVTLSTVHRAKGREADRVLILYPELMPAPYARTASAVRGEICVQFVALTRAKEELVFVVDGSPRDPPFGRPETVGGRRSGSLSVGGGAAGSDTGFGDRGALESIGQGPGPWLEVLQEAQRMALQRG